MKIFLATYVILINLIGLILMGVDKRRARLHKRRIPERVLFLAAILLGSAGILTGMYLFRHKTKKLRFSIGVPVILILQLVVIGLFGLWSSQRVDCRIKSCEENGPSAEAVIRIQSINMSNVLADYRDSLMACAAITQSNRDDSTAVSDKTAGLLLKALQENTATISPDERAVQSRKRLWTSYKPKRVFGLETQW